jgi:hypothetical protein
MVAGVTYLRLIPQESSLDAEIADKVSQARREWAAVAAHLLLFEGQKNDTERYALARHLEVKATSASITFDELALLVEKREGGGNEPGGL